MTLFLNIFSKKYKLYKVVTLFVVILFLSCKEDNTSGSRKKKDITKNAIYYYNESKKESLVLEEKLKAINKSYSLFNSVNNDTLLAKILYQKSLFHFKLKEYDSLLFYGNFMVEKTDTVMDKSMAAKEYYLKGYYFDEIVSNPDSAFVNYNSSKNYFNQIGRLNWVGRNLLSMALIQKNQNDFFGSKETITEALQYLDMKKDAKYVSSSYNAMATNHRKLLNHEDAVQYYKKAITLTNSEKDKSIYKNNLATAYIDSKNYDEAILLLSTIVKDTLLSSNHKEYARVLDNLAYAKWLSGKSVIETEFVKALDLRKQNSDQRGQIASYTHLGEFYARKNSRKAATYLDSVIQLSKKLKIPRAEKDALKYLMEIKLNNVYIRNRYVFLQDSLYNQELKVKTQFAKYKYDDRLKQESILRLEKEKAEKELEVSYQKNQKTISFFGIALLGLGLGFVSYFFTQRSKRLKQLNKTAKQEATFETEAQIARRVHDDFGAKLNHTMSLVQNNGDKTLLLDTLEGLYNQSRNFSREINEIDTGANYKNELFEMLSTYAAEVKLFTLGTKEIDWTSINQLNKTVVYKVLRELMINMRKYSKATTVTLNFKKTSAGLKIGYLDDGVGASVKELQLKNGLKITENRINAVGGTIIFDSEKGNGFKAEIQIPN